MRKLTRAFQLESIQDRVIYAVKLDDTFYPIVKGEKEHFIRGKGWQKLGKRKIHEVGNLPEDWTAEDIQKIYNEWGYPVACGMLHGWGGSSLFDDGSYGLDYAKYEVQNMCLLGKEYDAFTDKLQALNGKFLQGVLNKGFRVDGKCLWYKDDLVSFIGLYESMPFFPSLYIDHCIMGLARIKPLFDPISFDKALAGLLYAIGKHNGEDHYILDRIVSVKDRIAFLTSPELAQEFEGIFEDQEKLSPA